MNQSTSQSTSQLTNQPNNQPTNQPTNRQQRGTGQSIKQSISQSVNQAIKQARQLIHQPSNQSNLSTSHKQQGGEINQPQATAGREQPINQQNHKLTGINQSQATGGRYQPITAYRGGTGGTSYLVGDDEKRGLLPLHLEYHRLQPGNDVQVALTARVAVAQLVLLAGSIFLGKARLHLPANTHDKKKTEKKRHSIQESSRKTQKDDVLRRSLQR